MPDAASVILQFMAFLQYANSTLLKMVQPAPKGNRELNLYEMVFDPATTDPALIELRCFLPEFLGTHQFHQYPGATFMHLEDVTSSFVKPSIADIKVGPRTYDSEATPEKIASEKSKHPDLETLGFQLSMRVYCPSKDTHFFLDRLYFRQIRENNMLEKDVEAMRKIQEESTNLNVLTGLGEFFNLEENLRKDAIYAILQKLQKIEKWFLSQKKLVFYASSLLLVYEGITQDYTNTRQCASDTAISSHDITQAHCYARQAQCTCSCEVIEPNSHTGCENLNKTNVSHSATSQNRYLSASQNHVEVKMIDFAHVFSSTEIDHNYLYGLQNLMSYLRRLLHNY